jgi:hypothetical protein
MLHGILCLDTWQRFSARGTQCPHDASGVKSDINLRNLMFF